PNDPPWRWFLLPSFAHPASLCASAPARPGVQLPIGSLRFPSPFRGFLPPNLIAEEKRFFLSLQSEVRKRRVISAFFDFFEYSSSCFLAALGDMTVAPSSSTEIFSSNVTESEATTSCEDSTEGDCGSGSVNDSKMTRVCDKLIEVFMVDKPTTTDWRRLLAFSKEWSNIRPHFYLRCEERADGEGDPGMKHKLLRLGRKLKEIDEDVQRHNELLEVIQEAPDEISAIVARRRKDFTKEFFVHLHTVAESYFNEPSNQNGKA
ncbi:hypothetical protein BHE74_00015271, partial [Ensete ventricosum]